MSKKLKPMHPGEVLREEFLVPLKMSAGALATSRRKMSDVAPLLRICWQAENCKIERDWD